MMSCQNSLASLVLLPCTVAQSCHNCTSSWLLQIILTGRLACMANTANVFMWTLIFCTFFTTLVTFCTHEQGKSYLEWNFVEFENFSPAGTALPLS